MKKQIWLLLILTIVFISGCGAKESTLDVGGTNIEEKNKEVEDTDISKNENEENKNNVGSNLIEDESEKNKEPLLDTQEDEEDFIEKNTFNSIYTNAKINEEQVKRNPFFVIVENSKKARPQSGIAYADIVYEILVEGGITRYLALFQSQTSKNIGPVRSTRPYIQETTIPYNIGYAHSGGSYQALDQIKELGLKSINEMKYGNYFWRYSKRKAPHNLYTEAEKIKKLFSQKGYSNATKFPYSFTNEVDSILTDAKTVKVTPSYYTSATFEYKDNKYFRYQDGVADKDLRTDKPVSVENIIVQLTDVTYLNNEYKHIELRLLGEGEGFLFQGGKAKKVTWKRDNIKNYTRLYNEDGKEVKLLSGQTWWYLINKKSKVEYN